MIAAVRVGLVMSVLPVRDQVAPAYAEQRSTLAKKIGLGRKPVPAPVAPEPKPAVAQRPAVRVGGRRKST